MNLGRSDEGLVDDVHPTARYPLPSSNLRSYGRAQTFIVFTYP